MLNFPFWVLENGMFSSLFTADSENCSHFCFLLKMLTLNLPVDVISEASKCRYQLCNSYRPDTRRCCMCAWKAFEHIQPCKKLPISESLVGKEDPGAIISGVYQRRIIPPRLRRVSLSARPPHHDAAEPMSPAEWQAVRFCLFVWVCACASAWVTQSGPVKR